MFFNMATRPVARVQVPQSPSNFGAVSARKLLLTSVELLLFLFLQAVTKHRTSIGVDLGRFTL